MWYFLSACWPNKLPRRGEPVKEFWRPNSFAGLILETEDGFRLRPENFLAEGERDLLEKILKAPCVFFSFDWESSVENKITFVDFKQIEVWLWEGEYDSWMFVDAPHQVDYKWKTCWDYITWLISMIS